MNDDFVVFVFVHLHICVGIVCTYIKVSGTRSQAVSNAMHTTTGEVESKKINSFLMFLGFLINKRFAGKR